MHRLNQLPAPSHASAQSFGDPLATEVIPAHLGGLYESFLAAKTRSPDSVAIFCGNSSRTYAQLDRLAGAIAALLAARSLPSGTAVAICMGDGILRAAALLGILKAGCVAAMIDSERRADAVSTMIRQSAAQVLLCDYAPGLLGASTAEAIPVSLDALDQPSHPVAGAVDAEPSSAAFLRFDRDLNGTPAVVTQTAALAVVLDVNARLEIQSSDSLLALSSCESPLAIYDCFGMWAAGGSVVLPAAGNSTPADWCELIDRHKVSVWSSVPQTFERLIEASDEEALSRLASLNHVLLTGEGVTPRLVRQAEEAIPTCSVLGLITSSDAALWLAWFDPHDIDTADSPLGPTIYPLAGQALEVVSPGDLSPEVGTIGQIFAGSQMLTRRPGDTTHGFRNSSRHGRRVPGGGIQLLPWLDRKVATHAGTIDLDHVEEVLSQHLGVRQVAVIAKHLESMDQAVLLAFWTPARRSAADAHELRGFVTQQLANLALPIHFVRLEELALTSAGAIDRSLLPIDAAFKTTLSDQFLPPVDHVERVLVDLWELVLDRQPVGVNERFFELGGREELAEIVLDKIHEQFGDQVPRESAAQLTTIRSQAILIRSTTHLQRSPVTPIQLGDTPALFCIPGISGMLTEFVELAKQLGPKQTVYGIRPLGVDDEEVPHETINDMAECYVDEIQKLQPEGPYYLAGYSLGGVAAYEVARRLRARGQSVALLALFDTFLWGKHGSLLERFERHWNFLAQQDMSGRLRYFKARSMALLGGWHGKSMKKAIAARSQQFNLAESRYRVAQAHMNAFRCYKPGPYEGDVLIFAATKHSGGVIDMPVDATFGWSNWIKGAMKIHSIQANHMEILSGSHLEAIATQLRQQIQAARTERI